eukprot:CAMPEP_0185557524 /NCGR_PEP_ID=MMETSP1381-20130426/50022_1 /TAXON_ID=298111 /ORGANISM="Pavlova sp., Strain CCMP459" /LENGTH=89 /DNA_ID=CAMNT_0028170989 /DNA_START=143 /DNA_END=412 /DNA_ORIENTATION=+
MPGNCCLTNSSLSLAGGAAREASEYLRNSRPAAPPLAPSSASAPPAARVEPRAGVSPLAYASETTKTTARATAMSAPETMNMCPCRVAF